MTPRSGPRAHQTYVVCLRCGAELEYDWKHMRMGKRIGSPLAQHAGPTFRQMFLAPFVLLVRFCRAMPKWLAHHVGRHLQLFPRWHWH